MIVIRTLILGCKVLSWNTNLNYLAKKTMVVVMVCGFDDADPCMVVVVWLRFTWCGDKGWLRWLWSEEW